MKLKPIYILALLASLSFHNAIAAPDVKHNHNGRVHSHALPITGVKHYHKHMHNGRAHIHPYSTKVGFKHSHNKGSQSKAWANAVKHEHGGRPHLHPLPKSGIKHNHQHRHGGRTHSHPLPVSGAKHFHQMNKRSNNTPSAPRMITGLSIQQQMDAVLNRPIRNIQKTRINQERTTVKTNTKTKKQKNSQTNIPKRSAPIINSNTLKKVLAYGVHKHGNKAHQHNLPSTGKNHTHKKAVSKSVKSKGVVAKQPIVKKTVKKRIIQEKPSKTKQLFKPYKATPEQIASGNRQFALALRYEHGTGVKKNLIQAINWYLRAAKQGNIKAQFNLASLYENSEGTNRNIAQAIRWYTTAAYNGDVNAQVNLGNQYARGINVPKNINEAAKWYKRAADQGDMRGRANLNYLIEGNNGVIKR